MAGTSPASFTCAGVNISSRCGTSLSDHPAPTGHDLLLPRLMSAGRRGAAALVPARSWFVFSSKPRLECFCEAQGRAHLHTF